MAVRAVVGAALPLLRPHLGGFPSFLRHPTISTSHRCVPPQLLFSTKAVENVGGSFTKGGFAIPSAQARPFTGLARRAFATEAVRLLLISPL